MAKLVDELSNLEIKHVGKLAIIGASLKAIKTSCVVPCEVALIL